MRPPTDHLSRTPTRGPSDTGLEGPRRETRPGQPGTCPPPPPQNPLSGLSTRDAITRKLSRNSRTCSQTSYPPRNQRRINPDAPVHRIELKDPKKTINGRLFALPEKFLNSMIDFLEEHLLAGHIRPSKSQFAAGTWMIPNKDPTAMPRIVGAMQGQRETLLGT